jgi:transposase
MPGTVAGSPSSYGPNLRALTVYLLVFQHIPVERTARLIKDVTGAEVSTGWAASLIPGAAGLVEDSVDLIRALLVMGHVLHADETTTRIGSVRRWLHLACTDFLTLLHLAPRSYVGADAGRRAAALPRRPGPRLAVPLCRMHPLRSPVVQRPSDP